MLPMTTTQTYPTRDIEDAWYLYRSPESHDAYLRDEWETDRPFVVEFRFERGDWEPFEEYLSEGVRVPCRFASAAEALDRIAHEAGNPAGDWEGLRVTKRGEVLGTVSVSAVQATRDAITAALA